MKMSDGSIRKLVEAGTIGIDPAPGDSQFQSCSVDLMLGTSFCWPRKETRDHQVVVSEITVPVHGFVLASTRERITLNDSFLGEVCGKSSWARRGLLVEAAGLVDPGFSGTITLELFNMSERPLLLRAGHAICQITFERVDWPVVRPYGHPGLGSHYQGQTKATPGARL